MESAIYVEFRDLEASHWWFLGRHAIFEHLFRELVLPGLPAKNGDLASFDLGCGMGASLGMLSAHGKAAGVDVSLDALRHCKERGFRRLFRADGTRLPVREGAFDVVTAFDTVEHIADDLATVRECFRVLKPGGRMLLSGPAYQFLYSHQDRMVHHQRRYTAGRLRALFRAAGFEVEKVSYINFLLFPAILPAVLLIKLKEALFPPKPDATFSNASIPVPKVVNAVLAKIFSFERRILARVSVPFGHSLVLIARKPPLRT